MRKATNPFKDGKNYGWGLALSTLFSILIVINFVTNVFTDNVIDQFEQGCRTTFADRLVNLERCVVKSNEARDFKYLNKDMCSGCGEEQLCLLDDDLTYCEQGFEDNKTLITLRSVIKSGIGFLDNLSFLVNIMGIMILFLIGFFGSWVIRS